MKIGTAFVLVGLFLLSIIFMLYIPNLQKEQYQKALSQTDQIVRLTKHQILLVVDYFREYRTFEKDKSKREIENALEKMNMHANIDEAYHFEALKKDLEALHVRFNCSITLLQNGENKLFLPHEKVKKTFDFAPLAFNTWETVDDTKGMCQNSSYALYKTTINAYEVQLSCNTVFEEGYKDIEKDVKKVVQDGFSLSEHLHKGKVYLMWINAHLSEKERNERMDSLENVNNQNYCISKISNVRLPQTGALHVKDLLDVNGTSMLAHTLDNQPTLTWISNIYTNDKEAFVFILSAYEKDFQEEVQTPVMKLVLISIAALLVSILLGFLLFRKWIHKIEILSYTARNVCLGRFNLRSHIKGNDDIGILGEAFDSMLDSIEDNLKHLDHKVQERTHELQASLNIKETLLKEIHHRVKNNLALTINFIKLQRFKIDNAQIQAVLGDIENRIYTMALLHTKLYESENLDSIDLQKYIEELVADIAKSYQISEKIRLHVNVEPIRLNIDYALPCGLLINECVTNAIKHAFDANGGEIQINFTCNDHHAILSICDNGKGLPASMPPLATLKTLGLQLIHTIVTKQLGGSLRRVNENGLKWFFHFTLPIIR